MSPEQLIDQQIQAEIFWHGALLGGLIVAVISWFMYLIFKR